MCVINKLSYLSEFVFLFYFRRSLKCQKSQSYGHIFLFSNLTRHETNLIMKIYI